MSSHDSWPTWMEREVAELLDEVDCDDGHAFGQDAEGHTEVAPDEADWTLDPQ